MTRDDLRRFRALDIHFSALGLYQQENSPYFCTPVGAEYVGWIGCDGVHFVLLPGDERVFCVDPSMGERGTYVLPVADDFREFLSFVLYCQDANPLSQIYWMTRKQYDELAAEDAAARTNENMAKFFEQKDHALSVIAKEFDLAPVDPFKKVKAMQAKFDPAILNFSEEYYDAVGYVRPDDETDDVVLMPESRTVVFQAVREEPEEETVQGVEFAPISFLFTKEEPMLPQDPNILLSFVNTKLRDEYSGLDALCDGLDADKAELVEKLRGVGYAYDPESGQFKPV